METTDICQIDEFKNDPICKGKRSKWTFWQNIFWAVVLVIIAFFWDSWMHLIDRILLKVFGPHRSDWTVVGLAAISLILVLFLAHFCDVDLEY